MRFKRMTALKRMWTGIDPTVFLAVRDESVLNCHLLSREVVHALWERGSADFSTIVNPN